MNRVVSEIQTTNISDTNKLINATANYIARQVGLKKDDCEGKGQSRILLKSYGGMLTSWRDLNEGNLDGRKNMQSWRGSKASDRKEKGL